MADLAHSDTISPCSAGSSAEPFAAMPLANNRHRVRSVSARDLSNPEQIMGLTSLPKG